MENLLDAHTLIWFINGDSDLTESAKKEIIRKPYNNFVSIASLWEIAIKISIGKLELKTSFEDFVSQIKKIPSIFYLFRLLML
jgi:PIN domain nuclease of toxin-antitoxin system